MSNLKEIEDRHKDATILIACNVAPHLGIAPSTLALDAHADRATLLAEVKRLKTLCGRAAYALAVGQLHDELIEAAK